MTAWSRLLLPTGVTLSRSKGSVSLGVEMLSCTQHDSVVTLATPQHTRLYRM